MAIGVPRSKYPRGFVRIQGMRCCGDGGGVE
jgi:hypothetical protein